MLSRSAGKPIFVGLSAAALVAAGAPPALAEDPTPSPGTSSPSEEPVKGTLDVSVKRVAPAKAPKPGDTVEVVTTISALNGEVTNVKVLSITASPTASTTIGGQCVGDYAAAACKAEKLAKDESKSFTSKVTLAKSVKKTTPVTLTVTVDATDVTSATGTFKVTYVVPPPPKPKPTPKPPKPSPSLTPGEGDGPSDGKDGKTGNSNTGSSSNNNSSNSGNSYVPPTPNGSFNPNTRSPQVALPSIPQPAPSVAQPAAPPTPASRLRGNERPVAQDLTFERMASTQIAWLAALLVAFSLLMTQLRLGRRTPATPIRPRGTHRRPRRGMFGK